MRCFRVAVILLMYRCRLLVCILDDAFHLLYEGGVTLGNHSSVRSLSKRTFILQCLVSFLYHLVFLKSVVLLNWLNFKGLGSRFRSYLLGFERKRYKLVGIDELNFSWINCLCWLLQSLLIYIPRFNKSVFCHLLWCSALAQGFNLFKFLLGLLGHIWADRQTSPAFMFKVFSNCRPWSTLCDVVRA